MTTALPLLRALYARLEAERRYSKVAEIPLLKWGRLIGVDPSTYSRWQTVGEGKSVTAGTFAKILTARLNHEAPGAGADSIRARHDRLWLARGQDPPIWYCRAALRNAALPYPIYDSDDLAALRATPGGSLPHNGLGGYLAAFSTFTMPRLLWQTLDMISEWLVARVVAGDPVNGINDIPVHRHFFLQDPVDHFLVHLPREALRGLAPQARIVDTAPWYDGLCAEYDFLWSSLAHPSQRMGLVTDTALDGITRDLDRLLGHAKFAQSELPRLSTQVGPHYEWMLATLAEDARRRAEPPQGVIRPGMYQDESPIPWAQAWPLLKKMYQIREAVGVLHAWQVSLQFDVVRAIATFGAGTFGLTELGRQMQLARLSEHEKPSDSAIQKVLEHFCTLAGPGTTATSQAEWQWRLERVGGRYRLDPSTASAPAPGP